MADRAPEAIWLPDSDLARRIDAAVESWQQGDVAVPGFALHLADRNHPLTPEAAEAAAGGGGGVGGVFTSADGAGVVTQTCDVVRGCGPHNDNRPYVQVSPVVRLEGMALRNAQSGRSVRYAAVPGCGTDAFLDLDHCTTVEKTVLAGSDQIRGCPDDNTLRAFGRSVARHRERFAFPNEVDSAMAGLKKRMTNRADKNSPEGRRVDEIAEIRAAAMPQWDHPSGYTIELTFIVAEDDLGVVDPDDTVSEVIREVIAKQPGEVELAGRLDDRALSPADRSALWMALAVTWTGLVVLVEDGRIKDVSGVAESEAAYSLSRQNRSARLDLEHLSKEC